MPSDNETIVEAAETAEAHSSGTAASCTVIGINFNGRYNQGGSHGQDNRRRAWFTQQSQMAIRGPVAMPKFGNKDTEEIGMFSLDATKWQDMPKNGRMRICWQCCHSPGGRKWSRVTGMYGPFIPGTWPS
ncbi:hypothetical protein BV898_18069 [Hypsibius exemplaris]|uniref:Uncharacterized protein n=1 Tax=Hypsibius exemplaris TaxID=2072580 RepID=A0A9X6NJC5_HYPEX|nr:hypothetical protein BV898_18069 [Hypsibius exemplaris]